MSAAEHLSVVPDPGDDPESGLALRRYTVTSADGTELVAWTNDVDGPTVLLCNGLGTNPYTWPALLDPGCGVRVISWNHRGVGGSARPTDPERVGVQVDVEDALALLDDADVTACSVVGWSIGVNSMFELAASHPERVTGLFAVAGVPGDTFASMGAPLFFPRIVRKPIAVTVARTLQLVGKPLTAVTSRLPVGPVSGQVVTHSGFMFPVPDVPLVRRAIKEFLTTPLDWYMHLALASSLHPRVSLREIDVPTAFVAAKYDMLASSYDMRTAAERIPDAAYVELVGSHFLQMEKPAEVHRLLQELLERVDARP
ncbi:MAG: alpha/beta hydrolase [Actinomycetota bacterium]|nr:alpha/beta hydrolase [Actinomycetota bacterium]